MFEGLERVPAKLTLKEEKILLNYDRLFSVGWVKKLKGRNKFTSGPTTARKRKALSFTFSYLITLIKLDTDYYELLQRHLLIMLPSQLLFLLLKAVEFAIKAHYFS